MSRKTEKGWRFLDHIADIRMEASGRDLTELFLHAAEGLTELLGAGEHLAAEKEVELALEAGSAEELLVDWLREIHFANTTRGLVLARAHIQQISDTSLKARLLFAVRPPEEAPDIDIKGVTYHGLVVEKTDRRYLARVIFDI
ncbi:MAG: archease [Desulfomonile tiedjei]|nr:archease [Desulfomonile tiedjei]